MKKYQILLIGFVMGIIGYVISLDYNLKLVFLFELFLLFMIMWKMNSMIAFQKSDFFEYWSNKIKNYLDRLKSD